VPHVAQVTGGKVTGAQKIGAQVTGAQVTGAQVTGAQVSGAQVSGAQPAGVRDQPMKSPYRLVAAMIAIALLAGTAMIWLLSDLPCRFFGFSCTAAPSAEQEPKKARDCVEQGTVACPETTAARRARDCAAERASAGRSCEVETACVAPNLRGYPDGPSRRDLEALARAAGLACGEELTLGAAGRVSAPVDTNPAPALVDANRAPALVETSRAPALADAEYKLIFRASPECDERAQFGQRLMVSRGQLAWQHRFRNITYSWRGTIDADGDIRAVAQLSGTSATGKYRDGDEYLEMRYPQCRAVIRGEIGGILARP
jgi:hypothetical protein